MKSQKDGENETTNIVNLEKNTIVLLLSLSPQCLFLITTVNYQALRMWRSDDGRVEERRLPLAGMILTKRTNFSCSGPTAGLGQVDHQGSDSPTLGPEEPSMCLCTCGCLQITPRTTRCPSCEAIVGTDCCWVQTRCHQCYGTWGARSRCCPETEQCEENP